MIHVNTEDNFYVKSQSIWHAPADMQLTLECVQSMICEGMSNQEKPGSKVNEVLNMFFQGLLNYTMSRARPEKQQAEVDECNMEDNEADLDAI